MPRWLSLPALMIALGLWSACGPDTGPERSGVYGELPATSPPPAGYATNDELDRDIDAFVKQHYGDMEMFKDDELTFEVRDRRVTVSGALDSAAERDALVRWLAAVPGVDAVVHDALEVG